MPDETRNESAQRDKEERQSINNRHMFEMRHRNVCVRLQEIDECEVLRL